MNAFTKYLIFSQSAHNLTMVIIKADLEHGGRSGDRIHYLYFSSLFLTFLCQNLYFPPIYSRREKEKHIYCLQIGFLLMGTFMK